MSKQKLLNRKSKKALLEIPKELGKMNKLIGVIGEALLNREIKQIKQKGEKLRETVQRKRRLKGGKNELY